MKKYNLPCNGKVLAAKVYSVHPDDSKLSIVLVDKGNELVVWDHNEVYNDFHNGYYTKDIHKAIEQFNARGI